MGCGASTPASTAPPSSSGRATKSSDTKQKASSKKQKKDPAPEPAPASYRPEMFSKASSGIDWRHVAADPNEAPPGGAKTIADFVSSRPPSEVPSRVPSGREPDDSIQETSEKMAEASKTAGSTVTVAQ